jgi:hypothetical protein
MAKVDHENLTNFSGTTSLLLDLGFVERCSEAIGKTDLPEPAKPSRARTHRQAVREYVTPVFAV